MLKITLIALFTMTMATLTVAASSLPVPLSAHIPASMDSVHLS